MGHEIVNNGKICERLQNSNWSCLANDQLKGRDSEKHKSKVATVFKAVWLMNDGTINPRKTDRRYDFVLCSGA